MENVTVQNFESAIESVLIAEKMENLMGNRITRESVLALADSQESFKIKEGFGEYPLACELVGEMKYNATVEMIQIERRLNVLGQGIKSTQQLRISDAGIVYVYFVEDKIECTDVISFDGLTINELVKYLVNLDSNTKHQGAYAIYLNLKMKFAASATV